MMKSGLSMGRSHLSWSNPKPPGKYCHLLGEGSVGRSPLLSGVTQRRAVFFHQQQKRWLNKSHLCICARTSVLKIEIPPQNIRDWRCQDYAKGNLFLLPKTCGADRPYSHYSCTRAKGRTYIPFSWAFKKKPDPDEKGGRVKPTPLRIIPRVWSPNLGTDVLPYR